MLSCLLILLFSSHSQFIAFGLASPLERFFLGNNITMPPKKKPIKEPAAKRRLDFEHAPKATPPRRSKRKQEQVDVTETPSKQTKRGGDSFFDQKPAAALVTPPKEAPREHKRRKVEQKKEEYVPTYIHKNVEYKRKGEVNDETQVATFQLVEKHFVIPEDFENNRKYGPLSGVSFEERAISAYSLGLLEPKTPESANVQICSACAEEGHKRVTCPNLLV
jgi:hypothetical protein